MDLSYIAGEQIVIKDVRMLYIHVAHKMAPLFTLPTVYSGVEHNRQIAIKDDRMRHGVT